MPFAFTCPRCDGEGHYATELWPTNNCSRCAGTGLRRILLPLDVFFSLAPMSAAQRQRALAAYDEQSGHVDQHLANGNLADLYPLTPVTANQLTSHV
ncbi:DnaJ-like cysteine-rich domain-containing protein [Hymenobacter latericus]|uniref:hypothetical protein n=1 Tax=Hymenobacter sp. YIM 151858-1 TaxID=2987688 RepID=UPI0022269860|nr:hypothetical protein [Hymenobacter sp. YIM 151858-1]UYZ60161.1 hypothetical protein OIS50_05000 [Hymenobacter sp. YIM 151858-1]